MILLRLPVIPFLTPVGLATLGIERKRQEVLGISTHATKVIAPSKAIGMALERNGVPADKIIHVRHGIPELERRPLAPSIGSRPLKFLYFGRINRVKGLHVLLEAASGLDQHAFELRIVGNAVTRPEQCYLEGLRKRFRAINLVWRIESRVEDVAEVIGNNDVVVHPTICLEVFGLTIAETLAVGRPVIATRCGGAEDQIVDCENGILVPPNDVENLKKAMQAVIDQPSLIEAMAANAGNVRSMSTHVIEIENVYRHCIEEAQGSH
jgi:glycosyltransferase involved in cell wall biosynthesis